MPCFRRAGAALLGGSLLALTVNAVPATAAPPAEGRGLVCVDEHGHAESAESAAARGGRGPDHREVTELQQQQIDARVARILERKGVTTAEAKQNAARTTIPVYVHVMRDDQGNGDVSNRQISRQMEVLNNTFSGGESDTASDAGYRFRLKDTTRYNNTAWHQDKQSAKYRSQTRQGGANALNMWLVDFDLLGVATFPFDYPVNGDIDGIRVNYQSLPGGSIANYNLGETATHEAGHWLGLFHTFQGGCTPTNDAVLDTPAQSSPTNGCPEGRDSCVLPGLDPIHNYMDYSYDSCYTEFSGGQSTRMAEMFEAFRS
ncbi:MAG: hypothetical protein AVDCRST_MAG72-1957 [uncultured Nocardioidaceae bacterium]|uniref:Peptidase M43 pregnancy-associated plasma-A domain-containing protein n=1 Tax=uncultured Nocardioidaceae bacterium TaxID=253824 RepID=A0A6J4MKI3_9ACTN|nr:MAG: hypothetical protein AVDCRST_MAG72-1957 [uncultured Nocardioidaceae bacterium]